MKSKVKIDPKEALTFLAIGGAAALGSIVAVKKAPIMQDDATKKYKPIIIPIVVMLAAYFVLSKSKNRDLKYVAIAGAALPLLKGIADLMQLQVSDLIPLDLSGDTMSFPLNSPEGQAIIAAYTPQEKTVQGEIISSGPLSETAELARELAGQSDDTINDLFGEEDDQVFGDHEDWD